MFFADTPGRSSESGDSEVLEPAEALERHADAWRDFAESQGNAFVSPEWFAAWRREFGGQSVARVVVVRDRQGGVLGLLPVALSRRGLVRTARIAGSRYGDWMHPVTAPGSETAVATAAVKALGRASGALAAALPLVASRGTITGPVNWHTPAYGAVAEDDEAVVALAEHLLRARARRLDLSFLMPGDRLGLALSAAAAAARRPVLEQGRAALALHQPRRVVGGV